MRSNSYPAPAIGQRQVNQGIYNRALQEGFSPVVARIIGGREIDPSASTVVQALKPSLRDILPPHSLKDLDKAVERLLQALECEELISLSTDFDADGQTSLAILYRGLVMLGFSPENLMIHCAHRQKEGYGLNDKLVDRILEEEPPSLIVTADNGSSNGPQIQRLAEEGIDVIVTDHHALLEGPPKYAYAVVNPVREDCEFPDKSIAGCSVAFMLLIALRQALINNGQLDKSVSIAPLLTFSGVGVQADCVHLGKSMTNRAMVRYAIRAITQGSPYPCWDALKVLNRSDSIDSEFLSFTVAPAINAAGRLSEARHAGDLFLTDDHEQAVQFAAHLRTLNEQRKDIERAMAKLAKSDALGQHQEGKLGLCVFLPEGNSGVVGIVASRVTQTFGKPSCILAPMLGSPDTLTGSLRSPDGFNIKEGIAHINKAYPGLLERGGGHEKAGGVSFRLGNLDAFKQAFEEAVNLQTEASNLNPRLDTDGELAPEDMTLELVQEIDDLQPFGQGFPKPVFEAKGYLKDIRLVGTPRVHAQLLVGFGGLDIKGIWFFAIEDEGNSLNIQVGKNYRFVFSLGKNTYNGKTSLQLLVNAVLDASPVAG